MLTWLCHTVRVPFIAAHVARKTVPTHHIAHHVSRYAAHRAARHAVRVKVATWATVLVCGLVGGGFYALPPGPVAPAGGFIPTGGGVLIPLSSPAVASVPEPASAWVLLAALVVLGAVKIGEKA